MRSILLASFLLAATNLVGMPKGPCKLVPGVGCGDLIINKSSRGQVLADKEAEKRYADEGMTFSFGANEILDSIVVTSKQFATDKGVSPGDREERVRQVYGDPKIGKLVLFKGGPEPVGTLGDRVLDYPGVQFVISHGSVWAVAIKAK
jgi:hypothetical protein